MPVIKNKTILCPYCGKEASWVENKEIYGKNYGESYMCYLCKDCDAYVGCHHNSKKPLGTLANKELRRLRMRCHAFIDPFWKQKKLRRGGVYSILKQLFGYHIHIGECNEETCKKILTLEFQRQFLSKIY